MRLIFAGTPEVAALSLKKIAEEHEIALVITRPDSEVGRKKVLTPSPVAKEAERLGLPLLKAASLGPTEISQIGAYEADRGIVVAYGALLNEQALSVLDWWNLHFSLLPQWRGATPLQHSILHESGQGLTIFKLDAGMDTGQIVGSMTLDYGRDQTAGDLLPVLAAQGTDLMLQLLEENPEPRAQSGEASLAPKLSRQDARIRFSESAESVARKVMALNPEPMAWAELRGEPIRILRARAVGSVDWSSLNGSTSPVGAIELSSEKVLVTCGEGTRLQLLEVQPAGKRVMEAREWFRGQQGRVNLD